MTARRPLVAEHLFPAMIVCSLLTLGCGRGAELAVVSGSVSFEGRPVSEGAIRFVPKEGTPGSGVGVIIQDGRFQVSSAQQLPAGSYYVAITATRPTGKQIRRIDVKPGESPLMPEVVQYIPAKYNDDYALTIELPAGTTQRDFDLK